jgi:hypothetical protein
VKKGNEMNTKPLKQDMPQASDDLTHQPRWSTAWLIALWSIGLLVAFGIAGVACTALLMLVLTPVFPELRWKLPPMRCLPLVFVPVWGIGVVLAGWIHRSWKVAGYIAIVGIFLAMFAPCLFFLSLVMLFGGYGGPQGG